MSERIPQGGDESKEKGLELGELNLEGKSAEELEKMRDELTSKLTPETDAETASAINDGVIAIDDKISELSSMKNEAPEDKVDEAQEQFSRKRSKKEEVAATADEVRAMLEETSIGNYEGEEELESYGAELVNLIDWARRNRQGELVTELDKRIQEVKQKQGRVPKKSRRSRSERNTDNAETVQTTESGNFKIGSLVNWESQGVLQFERPATVKGFSEDGEYAFVEGTNTGIPVKELVVVVAGSDTEGLNKQQLEIGKELSPDSDIKKQAEVSPERKPEEEAKAQEVLAEVATPENATEEEKRGIREVIKGKWESLSKAKVLGTPIRDFAMGLGFGGAIGFAMRTAIRSTVGLGAAGAIAGAISGAGRRFVVKEYRDFNLDRAEDAFYDKPGSLIEKVKNNKITAADALVLIADWKSEITSDTKRVTDDQILEILNVEEALIKSQKSYSELKGVDKVEAYYSAVTSSPNRSLTSKAERGTLAEVNADKAYDLSEDIARLSGRRVSGKDYAKAALTGAIGGLIGAEVAHLIGGFFHHDVVPTSSGAKHAGSVIEQVKTPSTTDAAHAFQSKVPMPEHFEATTPEVVPKAPEVIAPKVSDAVVPPAHAEIPQGTTTHGVAVDRMNLDQATFAAPAPHEVVTPDTPMIAVELNPTDLALKAGINPVEYAQMGVGEMRVGDVMNTISNAAEHGALPDIGLRLDAMHPAGAEWDMTVDEFLKDRAEEVLKSHAEEAAARTAEILKPTNDQIADVVAAAKANLAQDVANLKEALTPPVEEVAHAKSAAMQDTITAKVDAAHEAAAVKADTVKNIVEAKTASLHDTVAMQDTVTAKAQSVAGAETVPHEIDGSLQDVAGNIEAAHEVEKAVLPVVKAIPKDTMWNRTMASIGFGALVGGASAGGLAYVANKEFSKMGTESDGIEGPEDEIIEEKPVKVETPPAAPEVKPEVSERRDTSWDKDEFMKMSPKEQRSQIFGLIRRVEPRKIFSLRRQPLERLFKDGKHDKLISSLLTKWESLTDVDPQRADIEHIVEAVNTVSPLENMSAYQEFRSRVVNESNKQS